MKARELHEQEYIVDVQPGHVVRRKIPAKGQADSIPSDRAGEGIVLDESETVTDSSTWAVAVLRSEPVKEVEETSRKELPEAA